MLQITRVNNVSFSHRESVQYFRPEGKSVGGSHVFSVFIAEVADIEE